MGISQQAHLLGRAADKMPPAPNHYQIDAPGARHFHSGDDVNIALAGRFNKLLGKHPLQRANLIAKSCSHLKLQRCCCHLHFLIKLVQYFGLLSLQKEFGIADIAFVADGIDQSDTRCRTSANLVQQTRARAVGVDAVVARSQLEHFL